MKKYTFKFLTFLFFVLLIACNNDIPTPSTFNLIKTQTDSATNKTLYFTYDDSNRLTKIANSFDTTYFTYEYVSDTLRIRLHNGYSSNYLEDKSYLLDNNGLISEYIYENGLISDISEFYKYNNSKFLFTKMESMIDYGNLDSLWNDDNNYILKISHYGGLLGGGTITYHYEYFNNLNTIGNDNFGKSFLGKSSKNLVKTENFYNDNSSQIFRERDTIFYSYEYDNNNRVIIQRTKSALTNNKTSYTYY